MSATESIVRSEYATMTVALKIWRFDASTGERELRDYELEAPEWACLLDVLDLIKDKVDGSLAYRKSCRMMICGSCGMRMDGAAVLACKERMKPIVDRGHVPVISAMGNLPIVRDLVVDMGPFWNKVKAVKPWLDPGYDEVAEKERIVSQQAMNVIHKEALCIMCGCCVSECNSMESDPDFLGPAALAKGFRMVGDPRDQADVERLNDLNEEHGIWDCTRCYFCNERCPKGVDPRDAIAKLGAESVKQGIDHDMGAKHANWFVISAKTTGLAPRDGARAEDAGRRLRDQGDEVRAQALPPRKGAAAVPAARRGGHRGVARALRHRAEPRIGAARSASSRASGRSRRSTRSIPEGSGSGWGNRAQADITPGERPTAGKGANSGPGRLLQGLSRGAVGEGARQRDEGARAATRDRAPGAGVGHLLRRRRHPRGGAGLLPAPERADPCLRRGDRLGHADDGLQRLHAEPPSGEPHAPEGRRAPRASQPQPRGGRRAAVLGRHRGQAPALDDRRG